MADFAAFAEAVGRALGWGAGTVLADYTANRQDATATQIEDSLLATAMLETGHKADLNWYGTATELLEELGNVAGKKVTSLARMAQIADMADERAAPHRAPTSNQWIICYFRENRRKTPD